jgi:hypothetical protein
MDLEMAHRHLAEANEHIAQGKDTIAKQRAIVAELESKGRDSSLASCWRFLSRPNRKPGTLALVNMKPRTKAETFEPVTMRHLRGHGVTRLLVYCGAINCNHHTVMNADHLTDDTAIRPLGDRIMLALWP